MKKLILLAFVSLITNGVCQKCADRFKENVPYFKGVKSYTYDMKTAKLTINYDAKKTNPDQLRQEVSKLGYNADNVKADAAARAKLPACCRAEKGSGCCSGGAGHGCGNKASAQGCGNHGNGQGCGNHGTAKACGNHGNAKACDKHQVPASKENSAKRDASVKTSDIRKK